jgi:hypothetical protein
LRTVHSVSDRWCDVDPLTGEPELHPAVWAFLGEHPAAGIALGPILEAWGWDTDRSGSVSAHTRTGDAVDR